MQVRHISIAIKKLFSILRSYKCLGISLEARRIVTSLLRRKSKTKTCRIAIAEGID